MSFLESVMLNPENDNEEENEQAIQKEIEELKSKNLFASQFINLRLIDEEKGSLLGMGFHINYINKVYRILKPSSFDEALALMVPNKNDKYPHKFHENPKRLSSYCFICGEAGEKHEGYVPKRVNKQKRNMQVSLFQSVLTNLNCEICYDLLTEVNVRKYRPPCKHVICEECLYEYLQEQINEANVIVIKCFHNGCTKNFTDDYIISKLKNRNNLLEKYNKFKLKAEVQNDPNKKFCPEPGCESYLLKIKGKKFLSCQNGHQYCFICLQKWHFGTKCVELVDKEFQLWAKDKVIKRCPNCSFYVEKNSGCNHMTCQQCKFQWCWICSKECTSITHYEMGPCKGLWFKKINSLEENKNAPYDPSEDILPQLRYYNARKHDAPKYHCTCITF